MPSDQNFHQKEEKTENSESSSMENVGVPTTTTAQKEKTFLVFQLS